MSAKFVNPHDRLLLEELSQDRFRLLAPLWFQSDVLEGRVVKVPENFIFDRESIPRWLPLIYALFAGTASRAGAIHDWLTQTHKVGDFRVSRTLADAVYYEANIADGNGWWRRSAKWVGVRIGGSSSWSSGPERLTTLGWDRRRTPRVSDPAEQGI